MREKHIHKPGAHYVGKLIGGVAGFAVLGPAGAVIGSLFGHAIDALHMDLDDKAVPTRSESAAFLIGLVVLAARMPWRHGSAFNFLLRHLTITQADQNKLYHFYEQAARNEEDIRPYAEQLRKMLGSIAACRHLWLALVDIARQHAGGTDQRQLFYLREVGLSLGIDEAALAAMQMEQSAPRGSAFQLMGISERSDKDTIRKAYRSWMRDNHPDLIRARGLDAATIARAEMDAAMINATYNSVMRGTGSSFWGKAS